MWISQYEQEIIAKNGKRQNCPESVIKLHVAIVEVGTTTRSSYMASDTSINETPIVIWSLDGLKRYFSAKHAWIQ